jgi:mono/diheme cytochrome c family protein
VLAGAVLAFPLHAFAQQMDAPPTIPDEPGKTESKIPDVENGNKLARKLCTACHLIGEPANAPVPSDVPSFASIANRPDQSTDHLQTWLTKPHPPMPNINLTRMEIRDLAGYILSLRTEK